MHKSLANSLIGAGGNNSVKRQLRIGERYMITAVHGATPLELVHQTCNIMVQFPDSHLPHQVLAVEAIIQSGSHIGERFYLHARLQHLPGAAVCQCKAYRWPHRKGGGSCYFHSPAPFCMECGKPCQPQEMGYRPAGQTWHSACCAAKMSLDCELTEEYIIEKEQH